MDLCAKSQSQNSLWAKCCLFMNMQLNTTWNLYSDWCTDWHSASKVVIHHPGFWAQHDFIIAAALFIKMCSAQKPGWWIMTLLAESQSVHQSKWRFFLVLSCIFINKQRFAQRLLWSRDFAQWSMEAWHFFCNFICVQNIAETDEVAQIAHLSHRSRSQIEAWIFTLQVWLSSWFVHPCWAALQS